LDVLDFAMTAAVALLSSCPASERAACTRLFFDVDDTLTWRGRLPEDAVRALYRAKDAGLSLVAVTGRSFAWGEMLVRLFPLDAVVAETGAMALWWRGPTDGRGLEVLFHEPDEHERQRLSALRAAATTTVLANVSAARLARDNVGRVSDTAFDLVEEGAPVSVDDADRICTILHGSGLVTARSSVHINAFAFGKGGPFDKATMVDRLLSVTSSTTLAAAAPTLCYVGDSQNDGPLFAAAGLSVGVGNVSAHLPALRARGHAPRFVVDGNGGFGFAQVVNALLEARD
jgi:HAD superfamily hydrolase (TIGR01484 family)